MQSPSKNIILVVVVALIVISIWYLQSEKPTHLASTAQDVVVAMPLTTQVSPITTEGSSATTVVDRTKILAEKSSQYSKAKELSDPTGFINTGPFKLSDLVGKKVILVDFWTYSCINCQRTLPYLEAWYKKYKDDGLVIVGVHTPEFDFEKNYDNVSAATKKLGVEYPVVLDSNQGTWTAYQNQYWPHEYLIDIDGFVVHDHIGEGGYSETEQAIQKALQERQTVLGLHDTIDTSITNPNDVISMDQGKVQSPETYFGSARNEYLANGQPNTVGTQTLSVPDATSANLLYLGGDWNFADQFAEMTGTSGKISYTYDAKNVYFVASSAQGVTIKVLRDGKPLGAEAGADVAADGTVHIKENRLYDIVHGSDYGEHTLQIEVEGAGLDAYTFTFG